MLTLFMDAVLPRQIIDNIVEVQAAHYMSFSIQSDRAVRRCWIFLDSNSFTILFNYENDLFTGTIVS